MLMLMLMLMILGKRAGECKNDCRFATMHDDPS